MSQLIGRFRYYFELVRFSHTVFALPFALIALIAAAETYPERFRWSILGWVLICMVSARTAAMAFNRLADHQADARNPRTAGRHLPTGRMSVKEVWILVSVSCLVFVAAAGLINIWTLILSPVALAVVLGYSLTKYYTHFTHFFLGAALALAPIGAWIAVSERMDLAPAVLGLGVLFWVAGFDVIYALQDEVFDRNEGLHSLVVLAGSQGALWISRGLHFLAVCAFAVFGMLVGFGAVYFTGVGFAAAALLGEHTLIDLDQPNQLNFAFFYANGLVSIGMLLIVLLEIL